MTDVKKSDQEVAAVVAASPEITVEPATQATAPADGGAQPVVAEPAVDGVSEGSQTTEAAATNSETGAGSQPSASQDVVVAKAADTNSGASQPQAGGSLVTAMADMVNALKADLVKQFDGVRSEVASISARLEKAEGTASAATKAVKGEAATNEGGQSRVVKSYDDLPPIDTAYHRPV